MKVKLKTKEQLIDEFGFQESFSTLRATFSTQGGWYINEEMFKCLGNIIEVEEEEEKSEWSSYTHYNEINDVLTHAWSWHKSWFEKILEPFEPIEFIEDGEFEI